MDMLDLIGKKWEEDNFNFFKKNTFEALKENFKSEKEFDEFFNKLADNIKLKFINCGNYYNYLKSNNGLNANIQLIMVMSIIEKIYSEEDFIDFVSWCDKNKGEINLNSFSSFSSLLECLKSQYYKIHGSKQKTLGFFKNYFSDNDKERLLQSLIFKPTQDNLGGEKVDFKKFINILYIMRNNFVHDARFIPIHKEGSIGGNINYNGREVLIHFKLKMSDFLIMFEKAFIKYFSHTIKQ